MRWIRDQGPDPIPANVLDQIMYLGVPSTGPDGAHVPPPRDGPQAYLAVQGAQVDEIPTHFHSVEPAAPSRHRRLRHARRARTPGRAVGIVANSGG